MIFSLIKVIVVSILQVANRRQIERKRTIETQFNTHKHIRKSVIKHKIENESDSYSYPLSLANNNWHLFCFVLFCFASLLYVITMGISMNRFHFVRLHFI